MMRTRIGGIGSIGKTMGLLMLCCMSTAQAVSLYHESTFQPLTADRKAHHRGDLITVMIYENASATSTADTSTERNAGVSVDAHLTVRKKAIGGNVSNQHEGRGTTQREGTVLAQITVSIKEVNDNGDLLIAGEQLLDINNEQQKIKVEGRVRPQDISDTNTVLSTRIADAKISYAGQGDLANNQRPGWWQRCLVWFGL